MKLYYPIAVKLKGKQALVVGGGQVAARKARALLKFGAKVCIVSPSLAPALKRLLKARKFVWFNRKVKPSDIKGVDIVIAATSDFRANQEMSCWANKQKVLVNVVDNSHLSDFISPALFSKGLATVAVYTDGRNPALSRDLKNFLKEHWDEFLSYRRRLQKRKD